VSQLLLTVVVCLAALAAAPAFAARDCTWRRAYSERAFILATAVRANSRRTVDFAQPFLSAFTLLSRFTEGGGVSRLSVTAVVCLAALAAAPALAGEAARPDKVSFYFAAHQDDWQLFMNPSAFEDVAGGAAKTVFVHVTAGDAGLGTGSGGRRHPYYLARENGAENAMRFMADAARMLLPEAAAHVTFNGHVVYRTSFGNTVGYFLRVPDGHPSGGGYGGTGWQSLRRLAEGQIATLTAIDSSASYHGWSDLVATVRAIMAFERDGARLMQINVAEPDARINPGDHSDHLATSRLAVDAAADLGCVRRVYYVDYASARMPENLDVRQRDLESSVFAVTLAGVQALDHVTDWRHYYQTYMGRNYFRVEEPAGACTAPSTTVAAASHEPIGP
jgi:hypothetical protein